MQTRDWIALIGVLLALIGLYLNNFYANQRERRKEFKSRLDKIIEDIENLHNKSLEFHTQEYSVKLSEEIITSLEKLQNKISHIHFFRNKDIDDKIIKYRQSLTLKNFDKSSFRVLDYDDEIIKEVFQSSQDLSTILEDVYNQKFPLQNLSRLGRLLGH